MLVLNIEIDVRNFTRAAAVLKCNFYAYKLVPIDDAVVKT